MEKYLLKALISHNFNGKYENTFSGINTIHYKTLTIPWICARQVTGSYTDENLKQETIKPKLELM